MDLILLETEAMSLSPLERARLADKLLNSLSNSDQDHVLDSWVRLAEQRLADYERGETSDLEGPEVLSSLRRRLG